MCLAQAERQKTRPVCLCEESGRALATGHHTTTGFRDFKHGGAGHWHRNCSDDLDVAGGHHDVAPNRPGRRAIAVIIESLSSPTTRYTRFTPFCPGAG